MLLSFFYDENFFYHVPLFFCIIVFFVQKGYFDNFHTFEYFLFGSNIPSFTGEGVDPFSLTSSLLNKKSFHSSSFALSSCVRMASILFLLFRFLAKAEREFYSHLPSVTFFLHLEINKFYSNSFSIYKWLSFTSSTFSSSYFYFGGEEKKSLTLILFINLTWNVIKFKRYLKPFLFFACVHNKNLLIEKRRKKKENWFIYSSLLAYIVMMMKNRTSWAEIEFNPINSFFYFFQENYYLPENHQCYLSSTFEILNYVWLIKHQSCNLSRRFKDKKEKKEKRKSCKIGQK